MEEEGNSKSKIPKDKLLPSRVEVLPDERPSGKNDHSNNGNRDGFGLVEWIFDSLAYRKPLAYSFLKYYVNKLDLKVTNPIIYRIFLLISLVIDSIFVTGIVLSVLTTIIILIFALTKVIGLDEIIISGVRSRI